MTKTSKKSNAIAITIIVLGILILLFFLRGNVYKAVMKYEDAGGRKNYEMKDDALISHINQSLPNDESLDQNIDIDQIIDFSQEITSRSLDFSIEYKDNEPAKAFQNGGANCIGYAAFMASTANYLIKRFGMEKEWEARPRKGKLFLFGNNMHKNVQDGWFKDHDFVVFKNKITKEEIYADPTAYDYFGAKRVSKREK